MIKVELMAMHIVTQTVSLQENTNEKNTFSFQVNSSLTLGSSGMVYYKSKPVASILQSIPPTFPIPVTLTLEITGANCCQVPTPDQTECFRIFAAIWNILDQDTPTIYVCVDFIPSKPSQIFFYYFAKETTDSAIDSISWHPSAGAVITCSKSYSFYRVRLDGGDGRIPRLPIQIEEKSIVKCSIALEHDVLLLIRENGQFIFFRNLMSQISGSALSIPILARMKVSDKPLLQKKNIISVDIDAKGIQLIIIMKFNEQTTKVVYDLGQNKLI